MSKVVFDISMSLDGFITAGNQSQEEPLGEGGQQLHAWMEDDRGRQVLEEASGDLGAVIAGRETYNDSVPWWGSDGPTGPARRPVFVVTHEVPSDVPEDGVYTFVTDGIESALKQARAAANGKDVTLMGGADLGRQFLDAGLVDELSLHLVPVLFGGGTRLFEPFDGDHVDLEMRSTIETPQAIHLRSAVGNRSNEQASETEYRDKHCT